MKGKGTEEEGWTRDGVCSALAGSSLRDARRSPLGSLSNPNGRAGVLITSSYKKSRAKVRLLFGRGGIRTPGTVPRTSVFKTDAFGHSATLP